MSNEAALIVIAAIWLARGGGVNLCLVILLYYTTFIITSISGIYDVFKTDESTVYGTYAIQASIDCMFLVFTALISVSCKKFIKIYLAYMAIIGTSLALNCLTLLDQMIDLSVIYKLHAIRQDFSIPLDVAFAMLGSGNGQITDNIRRSLRAAGRSVYNRLNRISNHNQGADKP